MEARRTLTSSTSRTPRRVIPVRSSRCTEVDLLLLTTNAAVLLRVSTTTTVLAATEVLLKVMRPRLDLLSSSSTTAARKADHLRLRRTSTVSNSTEHRRATTRGTVIMGTVAIRAAAAIRATAAAIRATETGDRNVMRRDGRLIYVVLSVL